MGKFVVDIDFFVSPTSNHNCHNISADCLLYSANGFQWTRVFNFYRVACAGMQEANTTRVSPEEYDKISLDLALTALYVNMLKTRRQKNETFDWEKCFSLKGDSGISLQYCHARLCSIREANEVIESRSWTAF